MNIKEYLKKFEEENGHTLFYDVGHANININLWDSSTGETVTVNFIPLTTGEIVSCDMTAYINYGTLLINEDILEFDYDKIVSAIKSKYANNWYRYKHNLSANYNSTWNYDGKNILVESWEDYEKENNTTNEQLTDAESTHIRYGYDSIDGANEFKDKTNFGKNQINNKETLKGTHTTTETKGGNQGTTMTSEILRDDLALYSDNNYIDMIVKDVVNFMCVFVWDC